MALLASGNTLQVVEFISTTGLTVTGNNTLDFLENALTPKGPNSTFLIQMFLPTGTSDLGSGSAENPYRGFTVYRKINSGSYTQADNYGSSPYTRCHLEASPYRAASQNGYNQGARYRVTHKRNQFLDQPSYTFGDTITYKIQCHPRRDGYGQYTTIGDSYYTGSFDQPYGYTITEIAS